MTTGPDRPNDQIDKRNDYSGLKDFCLSLGANLFGVADIRLIKKDFFLPSGLSERFDKAICIGVRLSLGVLEGIDNQPNRLYFHHYKAVNNLLDQLALRIGNYIQNKKYFVLPIPASQILDWQNQRAHLSHKQLGVLAGLGWIGRNNLLVNPELGSQFRLASILTDMPLKIDRPLKKGCGNCRLCVKICPAGAIKNSAREFNHLKCLDKLKEFQKQRLVEQYICGVCVKACRGNP
jgi:epoxyqueuosine reductase QueG